MVLYLSIQLRCCNRNKNQNVYQTSDTQKNGYHLLVSSYLQELLNLMCTQLFHYHQEVNHLNVTHLTLNGNKKRPTMKKHLKIRSLLIERAKLQFKTFHLRN